MLFATLTFTLVGCEDDAPAQTTGQTQQTAPEAQATPEPTPEPAPEPPAAPETPTGGYTFGSTFVFNDLEITFFDDVEWVTVENRFSDRDGAYVARVPMSITNLRGETHGLNMFSFNHFGTAGTRLDSVSSFFSDYDVSFAGDMRSGATQNTHMHILYDGSGDYYIEFSQLFGPTTEVRLPLSR